MLTLSIIARLPLAMFSIGLLVHAQHLTGSFAAAGLVTAAYALALGVGGPLLGRVVDRRGQTLVLLAAAVRLGLPARGDRAAAGRCRAAVVIALAAGIGFATPPVGACVRTLLSDPRAFAVEASAVELTWVFGPPLALGAGALFSTGAALAGAGAVLVGGTLIFAAHPSSRGWRPAPKQAGGGALRSPAMRTLALVMLAVGVVFGAVEIGVATAGEALGSAAAAGPGCARACSCRRRRRRARAAGSACARRPAPPLRARDRRRPPRLAAARHPRPPSPRPSARSPRRPPSPARALAARRARRALTRPAPSPPRLARRPPPALRRTPRLPALLAASPPATSRSPSPPPTCTRWPRCSSSPGRRSRRPTPPCTRWSSGRRPPGRSPRRSRGSPPPSRSAPPRARPLAGTLAEHAGPTAVFVLAGAAAATALIATVVRFATVPAWATS